MQIQQPEVQARIANQYADSRRGNAMRAQRNRGYFIATSAALIQVNLIPPRRCDGRRRAHAAGLPGCRNRTDCRIQVSYRADDT